MEEATLSIGQVASRAGVSVSTIRFYERRGLLPEPERLAGRRRYTAAILRRLAVIGAGKRAGLSLAEIGALLASIDAGAPAYEQLRALAVRKLPEAEVAIDRARRVRDWLRAANECRCESLEACALFVA